EGVTRQEMDEFAARSQDLAVTAQENGFFEREITPVTLADGTSVSKDDGPRPGTTVEILAQLKPVFRPDGEVTAGNSCPLNDGAAAVVVMSDTKAKELGITPLARIVASGVSGLNPEIMVLGPVDACRQVLPGAHPPPPPPARQAGARIMTTLLNGLEDGDKTFGLESMCVGGGQGMAMIV